MRKTDELSLLSFVSIKDKDAPYWKIENLNGQFKVTVGDEAILLLDCEPIDLLKCVELKLRKLT